jgi:hypothetical protein
MLRGPFVSLFGPLFGSRRGTSKRQSYQLTWRSGQPNSVAVVGNSRATPSVTNTGFDSDSEEGIMKDDHLITVHDRRGSHIVVTNEVSVVSDELAQRKSTDELERQDAATASVNEDRPEGKRPFFHI